MTTIAGLTLHAQTILADPRALIVLGDLLFLLGWLGLRFSLREGRAFVRAGVVAFLAMLVGFVVLVLGLVWILPTWIEWPIAALVLLWLARSDRTPSIEISGVFRNTSCLFRSS